MRHRGGDNSTTPPGAPYGTGSRGETPEAPVVLALTRQQVRGLAAIGRHIAAAPDWRDTDADADERAALEWLERLGGEQ